VVPAQTTPIVQPACHTASRQQSLLPLSAYFAPPTNIAITLMLHDAVQTIALFASLMLTAPTSRPKEHAIPDVSNVLLRLIAWSTATPTQCVTPALMYASSVLPIAIVQLHNIATLTFVFNVL
jgi:hypothetical protein